MEIYLIQFKSKLCLQPMCHSPSVRRVFSSPDILEASNVFWKIVVYQVNLSVAYLLGLLYVESRY